jgi:anti-anti-sigma factor
MHADDHLMATFDYDDATNSPEQLVQFEFQRQTLTIRFTAPVLGHRESPAVAGAIFRELVEHECVVKNVVLDLQEVCGMSSMGLGLCVEIRNQAAQAGARCVLFGLCHHLRDMFRMMRIERLYTIADTAAELAAAAA